MITYSPHDSKVARATAVSPQFEAHNIWLPDKYYEPNRRDYPWINKELDNFIEEFKNFPYGSDDDCVDMTTQLLLKVGGVAGWFDELVKQAEGDTKLTVEEKQIQEQNQRIAKIMGWDLNTGGGVGGELPPNSGYGFDINF